MVEISNNQTTMRVFFFIPALFFSLVFTSCNVTTSEASADSNDNKTDIPQTFELPSKISALKKGIHVEHSKNQVYPELNKDYPTRALKYKFNFATTVKSLRKGLQIIEFGVFHYRSEKWVQVNKPFNTTEFSEWYMCPGGLLLKGEIYHDPNNWYSCDNLDNAPSKILWYYIGVDSNNEKYVGYDYIDIIKKMKN